MKFLSVCLLMERSETGEKLFNILEYIIINSLLVSYSDEVGTKIPIGIFVPALVFAMTKSEILLTLLAPYVDVNPCMVLFYARVYESKFSVLTVAAY